MQIVTERLSETAYLGECLMPIDQVFQGRKVEPLIKEMYVKTHLWNVSHSGGVGKTSICNGSSSHRTSN